MMIIIIIIIIIITILWQANKAHERAAGEQRFQLKCTQKIYIYTKIFVIVVNLLVFRNFECLSAEAFVVDVVKFFRSYILYIL